MSDHATDATPSRLPGFLRSLVHRLPGDAGELPVEGHLPSFAGATGWLNSEPLTPEGLRGRVVLVDFWTYTCVNWLRTLPYVRAWDAKYAAQGLTTIGVHTPEFDFERDVDNIVAQARALGVPYPIAVDSDYGVWNAFDNHYWPAVYIADAQGRIRYHHFGEGEYAMQEMVIQQLLLEAGAEDVDPDLVSVDPVGLEVAADYRTLRSPETYLGYGQATGMASPDGLRADRGARLRPAIELAPQPVGAVGRLVDLAARRHGDGAERTARHPLPGPRCEPGDGAGGPRHRDPLPRVPRRPAGNRRARNRRRCRRQRHGRGAAHLPAHPPTGPDHRARLRDRVPRPGRRALLLHLRLIGGNGLERERHGPWFMTHLDPMTPLDTANKETVMTTTITERDTAMDSATPAIQPVPRRRTG